MRTRRWFLLTATLAVAAVPAAVSLAQQSPPTTGSASLRETLVFGLRPRTPGDEAFIDLVLLKTEMKVLPLDLVVSTFRYAQGKRPYPFPYFERALRVRARQIGVEL